jgi:hypothetical protein
MAYKDVRGETITELVTKVKAEIAKGFWPMPGGFIQEDDGNTPEKWVQIMVEVARIPPQTVIITNTAAQKIPVETSTTAAPVVEPQSGRLNTEIDLEAVTKKKKKKVTAAKKKTASKA